MYSESILHISFLYSQSLKKLKSIVLYCFIFSVFLSNPELLSGYSYSVPKFSLGISISIYLSPYMSIYLFFPILDEPISSICCLRQSVSGELYQNKKYSSLLLTTLSPGMSKYPVRLYVSTIFISAISFFLSSEI